LVRLERPRPIEYLTHLLFFYNQILGLSGTLTAAAVTIGIVSDAFTDPLVGSISDRWQSRLGRRHHVMFAAPLPQPVHTGYYDSLVVLTPVGWKFRLRDVRLNGVFKVKAVYGW